MIYCKLHLPNQIILYKITSQKTTYLPIVSHDIVKPGQQSETGSHLWVHGPIDIIQKVQSFPYEIISLLQQPLLYLRLATCEEMICIRSLQCLRCYHITTNSFWFDLSEWSVLIFLCHLWY